MDDQAKSESLQNQPEISSPDSRPLPAATARLRLRAPEILENFPDGFIALDSDWRVIYANRIACKISGKPMHELLAKSCWEEWPELVGTETEVRFRQAMTDRKEVHFEHSRGVAPHAIWTEVHAYPFQSGLNIFSHDITERKRAEAALRASEERFRSMTNALPQIMWTTDALGQANYYNQRWYEYSGLPSDVLEPAAMTQVIHPDDKARIEDAWKTAVETSSVWEVQFRLRRWDGQYRLHLGRTVPIRDGGRIVHWIGTSTDIEDQAKAIHGLRRSQENLQLAIDAAQLGTFYCEFPLDKIEWNETCRMHFYLDPDTQVDFSLFYSLLHPEDVEPTRSAIDKALAERAMYDVEYRVPGPQGQLRWINAVGRMYYADDGQPVRFDGVTIDITSRKKAQRELEQTAQRESLINHIGEAIRTLRDPRKIQSTALRALGVALGVDRCYFAWINTAEDTIRIEEDFRTDGLVSLAGEYQLSSFGADLELIFASGATLRIEDNQQNQWPERAAEALAHVGLRSVISIPFHRDGSLTAALGAGMATVPRVWTNEEITLAEAVAVMVRSAVDSAQTARNQQAIAQQLQAALQPATPSSVPGLSLAQYYRPALKDEGVGGDFSDVFAADKGRTFLVVGDLSGKGLAAASQVAMIRHMLRFALYNSASVSDAVTQLNATLVGNDLLNGFSTLFVGRYDAFTQTMTYVNAGQDAGLVLRSATGDLETLPPTGPVLGAFGEADFAEQVVHLAPEDILAVYTDGLTEVGPTRTELLTGEGVASLMKHAVGDTDPQEVVKRLIGDVDAYAEQGIRDDQCLLVAIATPDSSALARHEAVST